MMAPWLALLSRAFLIMIFGVAAAGKLRSHKAAAQSLATLLPLPNGTAMSALAGTIAIELAIAATLIEYPTAGAWAAFSFTMTGTLVLVSALIGGRPANCLCFGGEPHSLSWSDVTRNVIIGGTCGILLTADAPSRVTKAEIAVIAGLAAISVLLVIGLPRIAAAFR